MVLTSSLQSDSVGLSSPIDDAYREVGANIGVVDASLNTEFVEVGRVTNTRQLKEHRRIDRPSR